MKDWRAHVDDDSCEAGKWAIPDEQNLAHLEICVLAFLVHGGVVRGSAHNSPTIPRWQPPHRPPFYGRKVRWTGANRL